MEQILDKTAVHAEHVRSTRRSGGRPTEGHGLRFLPLRSITTHLIGLRPVPRSTFSLHPFLFMNLEKELGRWCSSLLSM